jgi:hypothetical protein
MEACYLSTWTKEQGLHNIRTICPHHQSLNKARHNCLSATLFKRKGGEAPWDARKTKRQNWIVFLGNHSDKDGD